jgi:hypothetical protein
MFIFKFDLSKNVTGQKRNVKAGQFETTQCTNRKIIKCSTVVYGDSSSRICGGFVRIVTSLEMTSQEVTGSEVTRTGNEREIISRVCYPYFPRFFSGTSLDSRYEKWNCESNLYRVTIALLPPMLNHFSLLNCAVSRD